MRERTKKRYRKYYRNFKQVKTYILIRLLIVFSTSFVFSASYVLSNAIGVRNPEMLVILVLGFLTVDVVFMRKSYYNIAHLRKYIMVEGISHGVYAIAGISVAKFLPHSTVYDVLFGVTDIFEFANYNISPFLSAVIFSTILFIAVRFAPLGMKWVQLHHG